MLYSFDLDGTLVSKYLSRDNYHMHPNNLQKICNLILRGDTILINTANSNFAKSNLVVGFIVNHTFSKDENGEFLFSVGEQKQIIENISNNVYVSLSVGCHLLKITIPNYETLKTRTPEDNLKKKFAKRRNIYLKSIPKEQIAALRELLETDPVFCPTLSLKHWGYMDPDSTEFFPLGRVTLSYQKEKMPAVPRIIFCRQHGKTSIYKTMPQMRNKEFEYLKKIVAENHIDVEPVFITEGSIYFGPKGFSKETPISFLSKELHIKPCDCHHFGNEPCDILEKQVANSHLLKSKYLKNTQIPEHATLHSNLADAISAIEENKNIKL